MPLLFRRIRTHARALAGVPVLAALLLLSACQDGSTDPDLPPGAGIALSVTPATFQVAAGQPAVTSVIITREAGFIGTVSLTIDSLPAGVTAAFDPQVMTGSVTASILTFTAADTAIAKTTPLKLKATAFDIGTDSLDMSVTVVKGALAVTAASSAVSIGQTGQASIPLSAVRSNGFTGAVTLFAEGLPPNVTATFSPALLPSTQTVSTLTLSTLSGAVAGTTTMNVRARAIGQADKLIPLTVTIEPAATVGYQLSASPAAFSIVAGTSAQSTVTVNRSGGFAGVVSMALTGAPAGVSGTITPSATNPSQATLTLSTTAAAVPGTYALTLTGTSAGQGAVAIPLTVKVTPVPTVTVSIVPTTLRITPGGFAQAVVLLTRVGGFTGDFVMSAEGLPSGIEVTFTPSPVLANSTIMTLRAASNAPAATANVTVKATAGSDVGSATFSLTVGTASIQSATRD
ncbi:MAG: hypothetical protein ACO1Q7_01930 [Gemmatimonas sp.]